MKRKIILTDVFIIISFLIFNAIPCWSASSQLKLSYQNPVMKVFQDEPSAGASATEKVSMARGEYQSFQLLVEAGEKDLHNVRVTARPLVSRRARKGSARIHVDLSLVGYVLTHADDRRACHAVDRNTDGFEWGNDRPPRCVWLGPTTKA